METASSIRFAFVGTSDPSLGETTFVTGDAQTSQLSEREGGGVSFYPSGVDAGAAVEGGFSSALSSLVVCCVGISEAVEQAPGAGGAVVQGAEAAGEGCVAAGAVLGWRIQRRIYSPDKCVKAGATIFNYQYTSVMLKSHKTCQSGRKIGSVVYLCRHDNHKILVTDIVFFEGFDIVEDYSWKEAQEMFSVFDKKRQRGCTEDRA